MLIERTAHDEAHSLAAVGLDRDWPKLRRTVDGAIDYAWYIDRSRAARSRAVAAALDHAFAALSSWLKRHVLTPLRERRERSRAIAELASLDDHMLHDIGLSRSGIYYAVDHGRDDIPEAANENAPRRNAA